MEYAWLKYCEHPYPLTFSDYQRISFKTATGPVGEEVIYYALKLNSGAGEVAEKLGKLWRKASGIKNIQIDASMKKEIIKELGDVLWYISSLSKILDVDLGLVAETNLDKIIDRYEHGVVLGEGDNR